MNDRTPDGREWLLGAPAAAGFYFLLYDHGPELARVVVRDGVLCLFSSLVSQAIGYDWAPSLPKDVILGHTPVLDVAALQKQLAAAKLEQDGWRNLFRIASSSDIGETADRMAAQIAHASPPCARAARDLAALVHHIEKGRQLAIHLSPPPVIRIDGVDGIDGVLWERLTAAEKTIAAVADALGQPLSLPDGMMPLRERLLDAVRRLEDEHSEARMKAEAERDEEHRKHEEAEAACAAMRTAAEPVVLTLEILVQEGRLVNCDVAGLASALHAALASDAGRGWLSPAEAGELAYQRDDFAHALAIIGTVLGAGGAEPLVEAAARVANERDALQRALCRWRTTARAAASMAPDDCCERSPHGGGCLADCRWGKVRDWVAEASREDDHPCPDAHVAALRLAECNRLRARVAELETLGAQAVRALGVFIEVYDVERGETSPHEPWTVATRRKLAQALEKP